MKQIKFLLMLVIASSLVFVGCQKEGAFKPAKKIDHTTIAADNSGELTNMKFTWSGNLLDKIEYYYNGSYDWTAAYTYDSKKRVTKIEDVQFGEKAEFTYDGSKLVKMVFYEDNIIGCTATLEHKGSKVSRITYQVADAGKAAKARINPFDILPDAEASAILTKNCAQLMSNNLTKADLVIYADFTWKGNNAEKVVFSAPAYPGQDITVTAEYDNKNNPLHGLFTIYSPIYLEDESLFNFSKNNATMYNISTVASSESVLFTYSYDGSYPVSRSYNNSGATVTERYYYK